MKIAITGGTGFVGRNIARVLLRHGHQVVLLARGLDTTDTTARQLPGNPHFVPIGLDDPTALAATHFPGLRCRRPLLHAGINREIGHQTFARVHVAGTRNVVTAAQSAGVRKLALVSFLRARPNCGSAYHESKWAAEEIVRHSGLDYTVFKCGVIYGRGDHMLDHLSHAFYTFPGVRVRAVSKTNPSAPTRLKTWPISSPSRSPAMCFRGEPWPCLARKN